MPPPKKVSIHQIRKKAESKAEVFKEENSQSEIKMKTPDCSFIGTLFSKNIHIVYIYVKYLSIQGNYHKPNRFMMCILKYG